MRLQFIFYPLYFFISAALLEAQPSICYQDLATKTSTLHIGIEARHTSVIIPSKELVELKGYIPEDIYQFPLLDIGYGDDAIFRAPKRLGIFEEAKSLFIKRPNTIHVLAREALDEVESYKIEYPINNFGAIITFIQESIALDDTKRPQVLGLGTAGPMSGIPSFFLRGKDVLDAPRTCTRWVAEIMKRAGCPIIPRVVMSSYQLRWALKELRAPE